MVKVPDPVQPAPVPLSVQLPVIELLVSVPWSVSWFIPLEFDDPDWMDIWKLPVVTPPVLPVTVKVPDATAPESKQDWDVVKLRLVTVTVLPLWVRVTLKERSCVPLSVADQFPLMVLLLLLESPPQAVSASAIESKIAMPSCFTESSTRWQVSTVESPSSTSQAA